MLDGIDIKGNLKAAAKMGSMFTFLALKKLKGLLTGGYNNKLITTYLLLTPYASYSCRKYSLPSWCQYAVEISGALALGSFIDFHFYY